MPDRILVDFAGEGEGVAGLAWGQQIMWNAAGAQNSILPLGDAMALPEGMTVGDVVALVRFVMSRHPSLRTLIRPDGNGGMEQVVHSSGQIALEVAEAGGADPTEVADAMRIRFRETPMEYAVEWPVRFGVVVAQGRPTHVVAIYCHIATDAHGLVLLMTDLSKMDPATGRSDVRIEGTPPLEQARWQRSPAGVAHSVRSIGHFEQLLRSIPSDRFPGLGDERQPRHWQAVYRSYAMESATTAITERVGLDPTPVLFASFAVALARVTGRSPTATQVIVSNRFRRDLSDVVATVSQPSLCVVDVDGVTFDEAVGRAWRTSLNAHKHAYYSPLDREAVMAQVAQERAEELDLDCYFNDRRIRSKGSEPVPPLGPDRLRAELERSQLRWEASIDDSRGRLLVNLNDVETGSIEIEISADTRYVGPDAMVRLAQAMEGVLVDAVLDPDLTIKIG
jgi:hypothetical protein